MIWQTAPRRAWTLIPWHSSAWDAVAQAFDHYAGWLCWQVNWYSDRA